MLTSHIQCRTTRAPMLDRPDLLSGWLGPRLLVSDVVPFGAITDCAYDEPDHAVFAW
jgi:hypothetical protein